MKQFVALIMLIFAFLFMFRITNSTPDLIYFHLFRLDHPEFNEPLPVCGGELEAGEDFCTTNCYPPGMYQFKSWPSDRPDEECGGILDLQGIPEDTKVISIEVEGSNENKF
jgi:hypothetical protein